MKLSLLVRSLTLSSINAVFSVLQTALGKVPLVETQVGIYTGTATPFTVTHSLGKTPSVVFAQAYDATTLIYPSAADRAVWDATKIQLTANATSKQFDLVLIAF